MRQRSKERPRLKQTQNNPRISLSKSKRFDVFARDGFTCQYCGQRPPDIVLEVDHIIAVGNGGTNEDLNLITSCYDCNRGKRDKILGNVSPRPDADLHWLQMAQERAEIDRYLVAKKERDIAFERLTISLNETWLRNLTDDFVPLDGQWTVWLNRYSPDEIENAIKTAAFKYHSGHWRGSQAEVIVHLVRYVSAIMRNIRHSENDNDEDMELPF